MLSCAFRRLLAIDDPTSGRRLLCLASSSPSHHSSAAHHRGDRYRVSVRFNKVAIYTGTFLNNPFLTLVPIIIAPTASAHSSWPSFAHPRRGLGVTQESRIFSGEYYRLLFVQSWGIVWPFSVGAMALSWFVRSLLIR